MFPLSFSPAWTSTRPATFVETATAEPTPSQKVIQNLLAHIPAEASGFYLMGLEFYPSPAEANKFVLFAIALLLLVLVRWLGKASAGVFATTLGAFVLWMAIFEQGYLNGTPFFRWLEGPTGPLVALAYSTVITLLASAGKIK